MLNCVVCSKLVFAAEWWCLQRIRFHCRMLLLAANQHSLPKWCCLQRISIHCWNCVVCSELVFAAEIVLFTANQHSLLKLCCLQRKPVEIVWSIASQHSLPKFMLSAVTKCSLSKIYVVYSETAVTTEIVLSAAKQQSLLRLCCLQRISIHC